MAKKIYPSNDAEFAVWLANLINKATVHKTILKLTVEQIDALEAKMNTFNVNLALKQQKKEESVAQTALVKDERKDLNKDVGLLNSAVKSIDGLPSNIIEELGLTRAKVKLAARRLPLRRIWSRRELPTGRIR
jgi:hypothetical protein